MESAQARIHMYEHGRFLRAEGMLRQWIKERGCRTKKLVRSPVSMQKITAGLFEIRLFV